MSWRISSPTPYPDVNKVMHELLVGVQSILGKHFVGMYLYGSLALGDFDPQSSDIDFVVVTDDELSAADVSALQALHALIGVNTPRWATDLEGSYIPRRDLRRYDPTHATHPHVFAGHFGLEQHGIHWIIERHVLREHGRVLSGPAPRTLIDLIPPDDLRRAVIEVVRSWWAPMVDYPARLHDTHYQIYAVMTMCRVLYTLQQGAVVSKPVAIRWAREVLAERWRVLIERSGSDGEGDLVDETRAFIRYIVQRCEEHARFSGG